MKRGLRLTPGGVDGSAKYFAEQAWLDSPNGGKRLAAVKYLDWAQDIEFADTLVARLHALEEAGDSFKAFHVLLALWSMADQLAYDHKDRAAAALQTYTPRGSGGSSRERVRGLGLAALT